MSISAGRYPSYYRPFLVNYRGQPESFSPDERNYAFHWMDKDKKMIMRWDNAPYHPKINSFPHHKHKKGDIIESYEISLEEIIHYIESTF